MIRVSNLTHIYPATRRTPARTALDRLSLAVEAGEFCILSGPNGSGKSTLFRILCGMTLPSAGSVEIAGHDLIRDPAAARARMGVVFQSPAVDKHLSVIENLRLHGRLHGIGRREAAARLDDALGWSELRERLDDRVIALSGGLARQLELAKCLLTRPELLLLDEPTTGLDPASRRQFLDALEAIQRAHGVTVLMTTHIFAEAERADRVAIVKDGRLLAHAAPDSLRAMLGREMVVARGRAAGELAGRIRAELGLAAYVHGDEVRLEETASGGGLPLLERVLGRYRDQIDSIAIKQPDLEDVFIHLTGRGDARPRAPAEPMRAAAK